MIFTFYLPFETQVLLISLERSCLKGCGPVSAFYEERQVPVIKTKEGLWQVVIDGYTIQFELWATSTRNPLIYYNETFIPALVRKPIPLPLVAYPFILLPLLIVLLMSSFGREWVHPIVWAVALSGGVLQMCFFKEPGFSTQRRLFLASSFCLFVFLVTLFMRLPGL